MRDVVATSNQLIRSHHFPREISIETRLTRCAIDGHQQRSSRCTVSGNLDSIDDFCALGGAVDVAFDVVYGGWKRYEAFRSPEVSAEQDQERGDAEHRSGNP